jgi:drug/metabolite transporter (DMT)-like permease
VTTTNDSSPRRLLQTSSGTHLDAFGTVEWGLLTGIALMWGSSFLFMAIGLDAFAPGLITVVRIALGAAALALIPRARRTRIDREDLPRVLLLGITWMGVPLLLFPLAQQWIDSSVAGMLNGAMPLTTAAWAVVLLRRLPAGRQAAGLVIGFIGVVAISLPEIPVGAAASATGLTALGTLLVLVALTLYGLSANIAVPLQQRYGSLPVLLRAQLAALVLTAPFGLVGATRSSWAVGSALAMVPLGVLGTGRAFVMLATLGGLAGSTRGAVAIYFVPIVAMLLGWAIRGEHIHPLAIAGMALVLLGAWLTSRREAAAPAAPAAPSAGPGPTRPAD